MMVHLGAHRPITRPLVVTVLLLMIPLLATQFGSGADWTVFDFVVAGVLLFGAGLLFEIAVVRAKGALHRAAAGLALAAGFLLLWSNLAVGLIGSEDNPANAMYLGVLAVAAVGAALARLQPPGMVWAMTATALTLAAVAAIALTLRLGEPTSGPAEILLLNGFFFLLFLGSAVLYREVARRSPRGTPVNGPMLS